MNNPEEWNLFNPKDPSTHPNDNSEVEMKFSNGRSHTGTFGGGWFAHCDIMDEETRSSDAVWRYVSADEGID